VWINCHNVFGSALPFGGYKLSGWGREIGEHVFHDYRNQGRHRGTLRQAPRWTGPPRPQPHNLEPWTLVFVTNPKGV